MTRIRHRRVAYLRIGDLQQVLRPGGEDHGQPRHSGAGERQILFRGGGSGPGFPADDKFVGECAVRRDTFRRNELGARDGECQQGGVYSRRAPQDRRHIAARGRFCGGCDHRKTTRFTNTDQRESGRGIHTARNYPNGRKQRSCFPINKHRK